MPRCSPKRILLVGLLSMMTGLVFIMRNRAEYSYTDNQEYSQSVVSEDKSKGLSNFLERKGTRRETESDDKEMHVSELNIDVFELQREAIKCIRHDPHVLFFNRMPKCASTSIATLLYVNSERLKMRFIENPDGAHTWSEEERRMVEMNISAQFSRTKPSNGVVYVRHFYFSDFPGLRELNVPYLYVNMVRDPVDRFISSFVYYHYSNLSHIQRLRRSQGINPNEGIEQCLQRKSHGCETNVMTHYFCGNDGFCTNGGPVALTKALSNLMKYFAVVGVMEDMHRSLALFSHLLPRYFRDAEVMPNKVIEQNVNMKGQEIRKKLVADTELKEKIHAANAADVILYDFIKRLFQERMEVCGLVEVERP